VDIDTPDLITVPIASLALVALLSTDVPTIRPTPPIAFALPALAIEFPTTTFTTDNSSLAAAHTVTYYRECM
jgi:hypothetical protein